MFGFWHKIMIFNLVLSNGRSVRCTYSVLKYSTMNIKIVIRFCGTTKPTYNDLIGAELDHYKIEAITSLDCSLCECIVNDISCI
jgi:hypothetical protein